MKRFISLFLSVIVCASLAMHAFASEIGDEGFEKAPQITVLGENESVMRMEQISSEEANAGLPPELLDAIRSAQNYNEQTTYGVNRPSSSNVWNLYSKGAYYFGADFNYGTIYSNYVFTGHGGGLYFKCRDTSDEFGLYSISVYVVTEDGFRYHRGLQLALDQTEEFVITGLSPSDVVYFALGTPERHLVLLDKNNTYVRRYPSN